jgi:hypothetical protein
VGTEPATGRADVVRASAAPDARDTPVHPLQDDDTVTFVFTHGDAESPGPARPEGQGDTDLASGSRGTRSR